MDTPAVALGKPVDATEASLGIGKPAAQGNAPAPSPPQPARNPDGKVGIDSTPTEPTRESILAAGLALQQAGVIDAKVDVKASVDALIDDQVPLPTN